jgi:hypothetical protein
MLILTFKVWKKSTSSPTMGGGLLIPLNYETVYSTPELFKTGQITSGRVSEGGFATVMMVLLQ